MSSKLSPCVAIILCVAGCNSTETVEMPRSRNVGPPDFSKSKLARAKGAPEQFIAKPELPVAPDPAVLPVLTTRFEAVPNSYLNPVTASATVEPAFFSPIRSAETAVAMAATMPDAVAPADTQAQSTSDYIDTGPLPPELPQSTRLAAWQPTEIVSDSGRYRVIATKLEPARTVLSPTTEDTSAPAATPIPRPVESRIAQETAAPEIETAILAAPAADAAPEALPEPPRITASALPAPKPLAGPVQIDTVPQADDAPRFAMEVPPVKIAQPSLPKLEPAVAATISTEITNTAAPPVEQPIDGCFVNRGSNERMILVCNGTDVSPTEVFRAVVEGESAFRGQRDFDSPDRVIGTYGFNTTRFRALSQGPRDANDIAFLRKLRDAGTSIKVKGRPFDLYLMKGDHSLATVLVERITEPELPEAGLPEAWQIPPESRNMHTDVLGRRRRNPNEAELSGG